MAGIGDTLRAERRRQGRTLADAAAETRVRESYLAAIEEEEFAVLGGEAYAKGFIRLYGRYLDLDAEELVERYRAQHGGDETVTSLPASDIDEVMAPPRGFSIPLNPAMLAAVGLVAVLVVLFVVFRSTSSEDVGLDGEDPNAPGPSPAEVAEQPAVADDPSAAMAEAPAEALVDGRAPEALDAPLLEELIIDVAVLKPVQMDVRQGQPPVSNATMSEGDFRQLTDDQAVVFQVSDASAIEVHVNGQPLVGLGGPGQAIEITCAIGDPGCQVRVL